MKLFFLWFEFEIQRDDVVLFCSRPLGARDNGNAVSISKGRICRTSSRWQDRIMHPEWRTVGRPVDRLRPRTNSRLPPKPPSPDRYRRHLHRLLQNLSLRIVTIVSLHLWSLHLRTPKPLRLLNRFHKAPLPSNDAHEGSDPHSYDSLYPPSGTRPSAPLSYPQTTRTRVPIPIHTTRCIPPSGHCPSAPPLPSNDAHGVRSSLIRLAVSAFRTFESTLYLLLHPSVMMKRWHGHTMLLSISISAP